MERNLDKRHPTTHAVTRAGIRVPSRAANEGAYIAIPSSNHGMLQTRSTEPLKETRFPAKPGSCSLSAQTLSRGFAANLRRWLFGFDDYYDEFDRRLPTVSQVFAACQTIAAPINSNLIVFIQRSDEILYRLRKLIQPRSGTRSLGADAGLA